MRQAQFHAGLAGEVGRLRTAHVEHASDAGIHDVEVFLEESEVDAQAELGVEVSVELTFAIPSVPSWLAAQVRTGGVGGKFLQTHVESCGGAHVAVEDAEVNIHIAIDLRTEHHTAAGVGLEVLQGAGTCPCGFAHVVAHHAASFRTSVEEVAHF